MKKFLWVFVLLTVVAVAFPAPQAQADDTDQPTYLQLLQDNEWLRKEVGRWRSWYENTRVPAVREAAYNEGWNEAWNRAWRNGYNEGQKDAAVAFRKEIEEYEKLLGGMETALVSSVEKAKFVAQPILFLPQDYPVSYDQLEKDKKAVERGMRVAQSFFRVRVGASFSLLDPIVIRGNISVKEYNSFGDDFPSKIYAFSSEINQRVGESLPDDVFRIVFRYGGKLETKSAAEINGRGNRGFRVAIMEEADRRGFTASLARDRYLRYGILIHELGHLFGELPDVVSDEPAIMNQSPKGRYWAFDFPAVDFTPAEKEILRRNMK